jgi:hypothetical protein
VTALDLDIANNADQMEAMTTSLEQMKEEEIQMRVDRIIVRLKSRCLGLLEVHDISDTPWSTVSGKVNHKLRWSFRISYIHRTLADFLSAPNVREIMEQHTEKMTYYQPDLAVLMSYIITIKKSICSLYFTKDLEDNPGAGNSRLWKVMREAIFCAADAKKRNGTGFRREILLEELNDVASRWWKGGPDLLCLPSRVRNNAQFTSDIERRKFEGRFLSIAAEIGLQDYIRRRIGSIGELISGPDRIPLLAFALGLPSLKDGIESSRTNFVVSSSLVDYLLQKGSNPNTFLPLNGGCTIWEMTLHKVHILANHEEFHEENVLRNWAQVLRSFLKHKANLEATCDSTHRDCTDPTSEFSHSIPAIITQLFGQQVPEDAKLLYTVFKEHGGHWDTSLQKPFNFSSKRTCDEYDDTAAKRYKYSCKCGSFEYEAPRTHKTQK